VHYVLDYFSLFAIIFAVVLTAWLYSTVSGSKSSKRPVVIGVHKYLFTVRRLS